MLAKKNRAGKKEIDIIFKEGKFLNSPHLTFKFIKNTEPSLSRVSFIAPKSVARFAVKRNLLRRKGYRALKDALPDQPTGIIGAFIFKRYQDDVSILQREIKDILNKIN